MYEGYYLSDYQDQNLDQAGQVNNTAAPATPSAVEQQKTPWYENPGFWSKVGATGAALLPKWNTLKEAGQYASEYHQGQQLSKAQTKMLSNVSAGNAPMTDMTEDDLMSLTPVQRTDLLKTGMERSHQMGEEKNRDILTQNTLATGEVSRDYMGAIGNQAKFKTEREKESDEHFNVTMDLVGGGKVKNKFIDTDTAKALKQMGPEEGSKVYKYIMEQASKNPDISTYADIYGGKLYILKNGEHYKTMDIGQKPASTEGISDKSSLLTKAEEYAFREMLPSMKEAYLKTFGNNKENATKFDELKRMLGSPDPLVAKNARDTLLGMNTDTTNTFHMRTNQINDSLKKGGGIPVLEHGTGKKGKEPVDIALPKDVPAPSPEKLDSLVREIMKANGGKKPTVLELKDAYIKKYGGSK